MWTKAIRTLNFNGTVRFPVPGSVGTFNALPGVAVDVYGIYKDTDGDYKFERLNSLPVLTDLSGNFSFTGVPVPVNVRILGSYTPPGTPTEIVEPDSLPTITFLVSAQSESGDEFIEVFDERLMVDDAWITAHPDRQKVPLTGSPAITVDIADLGPSAAVPGNQFHFLRVGRVTRDEIDEVTDAKPGYMNSATSSFFPGIVDAPFGGTLQVGGHFGPNLMNMGEDIYYRLWFSPYSGNPAAPFDATSRTQVLDPLFNKRYILPISPGDKGTWQTMNLGPFSAQVSGTTVQVYQRPPEYDPTVEYYPFHDLMAIWKSTAALNDLTIVAIEVYEKTGEVAGVPQLTPITLTTSVNELLPLQIDNRAPKPVFNLWETGYATFTPSETLTGTATMDPCGEVPVTPGHTDGNECLHVGYSVEDGSGNPHPHLNNYNLWMEYSPRQVTGAPLSALVKLRGKGSNPTFGLGLVFPPGPQKDIEGSYSPALSGAPVYEVFNYESVLVPQELDGWPPEPNGDPPSPCTQYAVEVTLGCSVRTIDGWSRLFGHPHASRHIIIKR